ncbi:MAG: hypothetical protein II934_03575, partial [Prevotella sp.]|nr:hypothetical protein [Prevotella sp.]
RLALCSNPDLVAAMDANWSSALYVGTLYYADKSVVSDINSNLYDLDAGFKAVLDAKTAQRIEDIENIIDEPKCIVTHLGATITDNVYYTVENGQIIKHVDTYITYSSEATTVIYTKVELETLMTETPLTFEAVEAGTITVNLDEGATLEAIQYKLNDAEWTAVTWNEAISLAANDVISFRGDNGTCNEGEDSWVGFHFEPSNPVYVYGNMMSLIDKDNFETNTTLTETYTFFHLFQRSDYEPNTAILNHPTKDIVLPATTLTANCYDGLFADCRGITRATELPATTLADWCYCMMFSGTGITTAPALPATTLAEACYADMFMNCENLTTAPELPATTLVEGCYTDMFSGCTSLNYVKCLATDISADYCTSDWLWGVAETGTFVKSAIMEDWALNDPSGIPEGWTVKAEYTVPSSGIGTFSSPTNMLLPDGLTAHYCTTYNNSSSTIAVSDIDGGIVPANTGVLMRGTGGETYLLTVTTDAAADITDNALVAVVEATHIEPTSGDYTNFMLKSGKFVKIAADNGDVKMPANRAYLQVLTSEIPTGGDAKSISLLWGGDVTVIGDPSVGDAVPAQWYTIDGRKLNAKPTAKGLYIVNGKKVIIR